MGLHNQPIHRVADHLKHAALANFLAARDCAADIVAAADMISAAFQQGGTLLLCGNGGSAADCQHLAAEFTSRLSADFVRPGLPAIALTTDTSFLTAHANDFDFEGVFARQVQALGKPGDVLLAISTSGRSKNVVQAAEMAKEMRLKVIALTGSCGSGTNCDGTAANDATPPSPPLRRGGNKAPSFEPAAIAGVDAAGSGRVPLLRLADVAICVPSVNPQHIQEAHLAVEHILCHLVERALFSQSPCSQSRRS